VVHSRDAKRDEGISAYGVLCTSGNTATIYSITAVDPAERTKMTGESVEGARRWTTSRQMHHGLVRSLISLSE
jgi:hypothetical protein